MSILKAIKEFFGPSKTLREVAEIQRAARPIAWRKMKELPGWLRGPMPGRPWG